MAPPFLFPETKSSILPDPSNFFSKTLLSSPLPTNSFFQNFVLRNGDHDEPEYIHPYLVKSHVSSLSLCYPSLITNSSVLYQKFKADFTVSVFNQNNSTSSTAKHVISSFSDLSVTLDFPGKNLRFYLVRGSPYITFDVSSPTPLSFTSIHRVLKLSSNSAKYRVHLNNGQTWLIYSSSPIYLSLAGSSITSNKFKGIVRIALLPDSNSPGEHERILDRFSCCYPVSGDAVFKKAFCMEYKWEKRGSGDLLLLAHPLHIKLLSTDTDEVFKDFKYKSIDGELVGVAGDSWVLNPNPIPVTWHSIRGVKQEFHKEIRLALVKDVAGLYSQNITTKSSYFYGKLIARAARLALIAEEINCTDVIGKIIKYLKDSIEPWLNGSFDGNAFLYDKKWGGIVSRIGSTKPSEDFGFGIYNDHHYHLGYFIYAIAVLAKFDQAWGEKFKPQAYSIVADYMNLGTQRNCYYPRLRNFDSWKLHSWAGGLTVFADGRNQESTSEALNAYYSTVLLGLAYEDTELVSTGSILASLEIMAAKAWWHVRENDTIYGAKFTENNRVVSVLWSNKRDSGLWFGPADWRECRLGIQVLPIVPITEVLFNDVTFVKQLVKWTLPALHSDGWKGFTYALEAIYNKYGGLENVRRLRSFDNGNSLTNLLWWIHAVGKVYVKK